MEWCEKGLVEDMGKEDAIDDQSDIVAHQHRGNEIAGMGIKNVKCLLGDGMLLTIHLNQHTVGRDKGNLHAREKGGEKHCNQ